MLKSIHQYIAHSKALEGGNAKYPIIRAICKTYDTYIIHYQHETWIILKRIYSLATVHLHRDCLVAWTTTLSSDATYTPKSRTIADIPSRPPVLGDLDNPGQLPMDFLNFFPIYGLEVKEFNAGMQSH